MDIELLNTFNKPFNVGNPQKRIIVREHPKQNLAEFVKSVYRM
jgi:hypothetical protein